MDEELLQQIVNVMEASGLPADSSHEIGFHLALHYPEHARSLLNHHPELPQDPGVDDIGQAVT